MTITPSAITADIHASITAFPHRFSCLSFFVSLFSPQEPGTFYRPIISILTYLLLGFHSMFPAHHTPARSKNPSHIMVFHTTESYSTTDQKTRTFADSSVIPLHSNHEQFMDARLTKKTTSPNFIHIWFPIPMHVGGSAKAFQGVTPSFCFSKLQFAA